MVLSRDTCGTGTCGTKKPARANLNGTACDTKPKHFRIFTRVLSELHTSTSGTTSGALPVLNWSTLLPGVPAQGLPGRAPYDLPHRRRRSAAIFGGIAAIYGGVDTIFGCVAAVYGCVAAVYGGL